jgi:hypothetical protein
MIFILPAVGILVVILLLLVVGAFAKFWWIVVLVGAAIWGVLLVKELRATRAHKALQ